MLSWWPGEQDVYALIARKNYPKAVKLLQGELRKKPRSVHLRQLLADVFIQQDERQRAIAVLEPLVDEFATEGFVAKAIAVLKKIQRIDSRRSDIDLKLAALIEEREGKAAENPARPSREPAIPGTSPRRGPATPGTSPRQEPATPGTSAPRIPAEQAALRRPLPPTSEIRSDWFEEAIEKGRDFHWSPLLADFSKDELAALIGGLRLLVKKPGAIIYGEDEPGESLFVLASGKARVYRRNGVGHYQQIGMRKEGDIFGEASVLTLSNRRSTVTAATECELLELSRETFDRISSKYPKVSETIQQLFESRMSLETVNWGRRETSGGR